MPNNITSTKQQTTTYTFTLNILPVIIIKEKQLKNQLLLSLFPLNKIMNIFHGSSCVWMGLSNLGVILLL